jgi:hypothetical protein
MNSGAAFAPVVMGQAKEIGVKARKRVEAHWELLMNFVAARGQHSWRV